MCDSYLGCAGCPTKMKKDNDNLTCGDFVHSNPSKAVEVIEKWVKEHLTTTNADKFKEVFGRNMVGWRI